MINIGNGYLCQPGIACSGVRPASAPGRATTSARLTLMAVAGVAGSLFGTPAAAGEYSTFEHIEISSPTSGCRSSAMLHRPASWQPGEAVVVLLALAPRPDAVRDSFVAALLFERVAVLERVPAPCDATPGQDDGIAIGMHRALDAMTRAGGAGPVMAIGYGPGSRAVLDVLREPVTGRPGVHEPRYATAVSIGDGPSAFVLGASQRAREQPAGEEAADRLAALCRALTAVAAGMGATPERTTMAAVSENCGLALVNGASLAMRPIPMSSRR